MQGGTDFAAAGGAGRLVAVVVTYDRLGPLKVTLARLLEAEAAHLAAVVVIDNASGDGTADWLDGQDDPRLFVHRCETNLGGAGGFARGMRLAVEECDADVLVVMDDDARPVPGALAAFHAAPRAPDRAVAAAVRYPGGGICEMNRPGLNPFARPSVFLGALAGLFRGRARAAWHVPDADFEGTAPREIDMGSFVGLFVPREAIARCGYPDPGLFLYGDDVIYSLGLRRAGIAIDFDPALHFEHDCETYAAGQGTRTQGPLWKLYYLQRNRLIMYRRAAGPLFWLFGPLLALAWGGRARGPGARRVWARAALDGLARRTDRPHDEILRLARAP
ncbi:GT2 family glycosyltransferase [Palleronia aestuarii]|uniref:GT2 family glycosyltransferase n=2 Tax=Palleronia aestuarii TaxID=568105 RepID=A0A2W7N095_9RHOB|nr:GT2 family glycosyltransferase [Palleronia aestuarii]